MYALGYEPFLVLLNAIYFSLKFPPHYQGIAIIYGYASHVVKKRRRIQDEEIINYFRRKRLRDVIRAIFKLSTWDKKL